MKRQRRGFCKNQPCIRLKRRNGGAQAAYRIVILLLLAVFLFSSYKIADYFIQANKSAAEFDMLYDIVSSVQPDAPYSEKYKALKEKKSRFCRMDFGRRYEYQLSCHAVKGQTGLLSSPQF